MQVETLFFALKYRNHIFQHLLFHLILLIQMYIFNHNNIIHLWIFLIFCLMSSTIIFSANIKDNSTQQKII